LHIASLAQPTAITKDSIKLYFIDSETSAIRSIAIKSSPSVKTIIGKGLLGFGDKDGLSTTARLQYPMGISYASGKLYIADTMNHKIKQFDLEKNEIITLAGNGNIGAQNGDLAESSFFEPTSVAIYKNLVYVADTNNHLIRVIDMQQNTVSNFDFE
jgi:DNA-binding beta-propeller fold protein YncE